MPLTEEQERIMFERGKKGAPPTREQAERLAKILFKNHTKPLTRDASAR